MTDGPDEQSHDRYCGARTRSGGRCRRPCGWGTDHAGVPGTTCKLHLGASRNHQMAAERIAAEQAVRQFGLDLDDTPPDEIILREIQRSSAMCQHLAVLVSQLSEEELAWGVQGRDIRPSSEPGGQPGVQVQQRARVHPYVRMLTEERRTFRELFTAARQAGIEERRVRLAEKYGYQLSMVFEGAMARFRQRWQLSAAEMTWAATVLTEQMRAIDSGA